MASTVGLETSESRLERRNKNLSCVCNKLSIAGSSSDGCLLSSAGNRNVLSVESHSSVRADCGQLISDRRGSNP
eukprot:5734193-Pleurochrysis_carterae.AAC.4